MFINIFAIIKWNDENYDKRKEWIKMSAFIRLGLMVLLKTGIVKKFLMEDAEMWESSEFDDYFLPCKLSFTSYHVEKD